MSIYNYYIVTAMTQKLVLNKVIITIVMQILYVLMYLPRSCVMRKDHAQF
jgi:hypothetical protein